MAIKTLNTKIKLRIDTLENWNKSTVALLEGELALASVAASAGTGLTEPVVMAKIGTSEEKTFSELPWAFHAKASDVLAACKSEAGLTAFVNNVIANAGIATDEALTTLAGRVTTAEGKITTLEGEMDAVEAKAGANETAIGNLNTLVGDKAVATQISEAIAALNLATTYEAKGEAAKVQSDLDTYKTSNDAAVQKNATDIAGEIARAKAAEEANANAISAIKDGTTIDSFADVETALAGKEAAGAAAQALVDAKAYADGKDAAIQAAQKAGDDAQADVDALAGKVGTVPEGSTVMGIITNIQENAYDDTEIRGLISDNAGDIADLQGLVGDKEVGTQISEAITALNLAGTYDAKGAAAQALVDAKAYTDEKDTAMDARVDALEAIDHDHSNKEELDKIATGDKAKWDAAEQNAKDYADGLNTAMDTRVKAIEGDYLKAADKTELQDQITTNANAIERLTNGVSADEVDGVNDLIQYVKDHGTEVTGIKADIKTNADNITALQGLVGDTAVSTQISNAINELDVTDAAVAGQYVSAVSETDGKISVTRADLPTLSGGKAAAADAKVAAGVTVSGHAVTVAEKEIKTTADNGLKVTGAADSITIDIDDSIVWIFDCGDAEVDA